MDPRARTSVLERSKISSLQRYKSRTVYRVAYLLYRLHCPGSNMRERWSITTESGCSEEPNGIYDTRIKLTCDLKLLNIQPAVPERL